MKYTLPKLRLTIRKVLFLLEIDLINSLCFHFISNSYLYIYIHTYVYFTEVLTDKLKINRFYAVIRMKSNAIYADLLFDTYVKRYLNIFFSIETSNPFSYSQVIDKLNL